MRVTTYESSIKSSSPLIYKVNSGASGTFEIGTAGVGFDYSVLVNGIYYSAGNMGDVTITFPATNTDYFIEIRGDFPRPEFFSTGATNREKLLQIVQGGEIVLGADQSNAYLDCINLGGVLPSDYSLLGVTNGSRMFSDTIIEGSLPVIMTLEDLVNGRSMFERTLVLGIANLNLQNATDIDRMFLFTQFEELHIQNMGNVVDIDGNTFRISTLEKLTCDNLKKSFSINFSPLLVGTEIDNLSTSLADLTGVTSQSVTMTTAQRGSGIDETILTSKNWTIVEV